MFSSLFIFWAVADGDDEADEDTFDMIVLIPL